MKFSTRLTLVVTLFCALTTLVRAQHSLQLDNGLGAITIITGSSTGGTYTFAPGGGTIMTATPGGVSPAWLTTGNNGTVAATNFLGTIDNIDFVTRTNNIERLRITGGGLFGIGTTVPDGTFEIKTAGSGTRASLLTLTAPTSTPNAITFRNTTAGVLKDAIAYLSNAGTLHFGPYIGGTGALSISSSEFVGIGIPALPATSVPTERLEVRNGNILISNTTGTAGQLQFQNPAATFRTTFKAGAQLAALNYTLPIVAPTAGQVLSSDAGGVMSWVTDGGGTVTGTGTQNFLTKWNNVAGTAIGNSLLSDNGTTVTSAGTIVPSANNTFDLGSSALRWRSIYAETSLNLGATAVAPWTFTPTGVTLFVASAADVLTFQINTDASGAGQFNVALDGGGNVFQVIGAGATVTGGLLVTGTTTLNGKLAGAGANKFAQSYTVALADIAGNVVTVANTSVAANAVVVATYMSPANGTGAIISIAVTANTSIAFTMQNAPAAGNVVNYIVVNP